VNHGTDLYNARDESGQRVNPLLHISDLLLQAPVLAQLATFPAALIGSPGPFDLYDGSGGMRSNSTKQARDLAAPSRRPYYVCVCIESTAAGDSSPASASLAAPS
jgi:hypothetical protein